MTMKITRYMDKGTLTVAAITLILFCVSLAEKGLTHEILADAAVFLVSVKLLLMLYHQAVEDQKTHSDIADLAVSLHRIESTLEKMEPPAGRSGR
jgi:hypothetical protein